MRVYFAIAQFGLVSLIFPFAVCMQMLDDMSFGVLWDTLWKIMCVLVVAAGFWCGRFVKLKPIAGVRRFQPLHFAVLRTVGDFFLAVSASVLVVVAAILLSLLVRMVLVFLVGSLPAPIGGIVVIGGFVWLCVWAFTRKFD